MPERPGPSADIQVRRLNAAGGAAQDRSQQADLARAMTLGSTRRSGSERSPFLANTFTARRFARAQSVSDEVSDPLAFEGMTEEHRRRACEPVQVQLEPVDKPFPNLHRGEVAVVHHGDPVEVRRDGRFAVYLNYLHGSILSRRAPRSDVAAWADTDLLRSYNRFPKRNAPSTGLAKNVP